MVWVKFEEVKLKSTKRWTDADGKKRQKTKTFMQTVNPFNKAADGSQKTRQQIMQELHIEEAIWQANVNDRD